MAIVQQHQVKKEKTYFTFMVRISQLDVLRLKPVILISDNISLWIKHDQTPDFNRFSHQNSW